MKTLILALALGSSLPALSQSCPEIGLRNGTILQSLLIEKGEELLDVKALGIDAQREIVHFQMEGERKVRQFKYETCGWQIKFREI